MPPLSTLVLRRMLKLRKRHEMSCGEQILSAGDSLWRSLPVFVRLKFVVPLNERAGRRSALRGKIDILYGNRSHVMLMFELLRTVPCPPFFPSWSSRNRFSAPVGRAHVFKRGFMVAGGILRRKDGLRPRSILGARWMLDQRQLGRAPFPHRYAGRWETSMNHVYYPSPLKLIILLRPPCQRRHRPIRVLRKQRKCRVISARKPPRFASRFLVSGIVSCLVSALNGVRGFCAGVCVGGGTYIESKARCYCDAVVGGVVLVGKGRLQECFLMLR